MDSVTCRVFGRTRVPTGEEAGLLLTVLAMSDSLLKTSRPGLRVKVLPRQRVIKQTKHKVGKTTEE